METGNSPVRELEVVHLAQRGEVQLCLRREGEHHSAPPVPFPIPWEDQDYRSRNQETTWYLRDYLDNPFGDSRDRAAKVESNLRNLGRRLFEAVFWGSDAAQGYYTTAVADGLGGYRLIIVSLDPAFLALPWELLNEPAVGYLASRLLSVVRRPAREPLPQFTGPLPTEQLNVLLVSPWPEPNRPEITAAPETPSGSLVMGTTSTNASPAPEVTTWPHHLALETLSVLDSLDVPVALDVLRPATISALADRLASRPDHYHLVHFDGVTCLEPGMLVFEGEDGGFDPASASRVGELMARANVPLALLYSGDGGPLAFQASWAAAPAGLVSGGLPLAVSAPFPLTSDAGKVLLQHLYQALAEGTDVPSAVSRARTALMNDPHRPTPAGKTVFWDWLGPTVHQSQTYTPAAIVEEQPAASGPNTPSWQQQQPEPERPPDPIPQAGPYGLVGRWAELRRLEQVFGRNPVCLMWGDTGVGKSELALGLARWLRNTGARPGGVFYTSFDVGAGLEKVVHETGSAILGLAFADMPFQQERAWLLDYLREHPSLLILDSVESAAGFPKQDSGTLDQAEQSELGAFLGEIAETGQSWVLLISRRDAEPWLTMPYQAFELKGLAHRDALELGNQMLDTIGVFKSIQGQSPDSRLGPDYLELLDSLEGHPLAMQIGLTLLKDAPASLVLKEAGAITSRLASNDGEEGRPRYLTGLMDYSFSRMSHRSRVNLPFLSLFQRRVMLDVLTHMTQEAAYRSVMGEELAWGACRTLLRTARDAGFLEQVTPSVYQIHPSLPWFFGRRLHRQTAQANIGRLEREFVRVYADTADYFLESLQENQDSGATAVLAEEGNLTQALGLALDTKQWDSAQLLVQPLAQVYTMQRRHAELRRLRRQLIESLTPNGRGAEEADAVGGIDLWLYLTGTEANQALEVGELDHAEELNRQLLTYLIAQPEAADDARAGAVYHQLGLVAQQRSELDQAEEYFSRSLQIVEGNDGPEHTQTSADDYFRLGQVRQRQRRYTEAKEWLSKALAIHQLSNDPDELVKDYRALGLASQYKMELDEAESWYQRARSILEENRDEETAILAYHELGTVYHARYQFEEAESWYRQALALSDRLGKEQQMAVEFHHLGLLTQAREIMYEDAEEYFLLALAKYEALGDRIAAGDECRQLGVLFHQQKRLDAAEEWYRRACEIFQQSGDLYRTARTYGQLGMVAEDLDDLPGALQWVAQTHQLALEHGLPLLAQAKSHLARLRSKYGEERFNTWWTTSVGPEPPDDLEPA